MQQQGNVLRGIHHVSAITASGPDNYKFYTEVLGLRLVKKTVNQDDTSMYHLFYGDETGSPGTELTFFEIPMAAPNREGVSSISATSLRVSSDHSLQYWKERLASFGVEHDDIMVRAGRHTLAFRDKEGQRFILVSDERNSGVAGGTPWAKSPVPAEHAIIGLGPVHLTVANPEPTDLILTSVLGFRRRGRYPALVEGQPDILVYETGEGGTGAEIHLETRTDLPRERQGRGGVHHVAFRVADEKELREWTEHLNKARIGNSGFVERYYFQSLYFREPNGILFELATDGPGFATDEELEHLGESLSLPPFLEPHRVRIEAGLKPIDTSKE
ncbi:ring-cleaving dioxygenase [Paenibacillus sp. 1011MAR3C5]|uniref:ring-cleaving dioxygenase n=1 Tax=Paenibacillus sp. 1011MAR3C5 TaxID=1675787 RepID=UPI000E6BC308|nr:ring-cleaving dioxygenase [Paenibacillus sp. 1011MAR3C5]RJE88770.1 ring-cleaving dioxygenase [Paenibacillus sp. 1011MAR3C5]